MNFKVNWDYIGELMRVFVIVTGIIVGMGFIFIGFNRTNWAISLLGLIALLMGIIVTPTFIKEKDECKEILEDTPQIPKPPTSPIQNAPENS